MFWSIVQNHFNLHYSDSVFIFTDGSKKPVTGCAGAAVYIPLNDACIKKRLSDHLSVYTTELWAILLALQWIEEKKMCNTVIASDSFPALMSIQSGRSTSRTDVISEIFSIMYRLENKGVPTCFL